MPNSDRLKLIAEQLKIFQDQILVDLEKLAYDVDQIKSNHLAHNYQCSVIDRHIELKHSKSVEQEKDNLKKKVEILEKNGKFTTKEWATLVTTIVVSLSALILTLIKSL